jgi:SET domain-containing protein
MKMNDREHVPEPNRIEFHPSAIHGIGGFARLPILKGEVVVEYVGERISKEESVRRCAMSNAFIFALDETHDLDGNIPANLARFLNHSCQPNCEAIEQNGRIWIVTLRDIAVGEELTFNYGYSLEEYNEHPCHCGSGECVGFVLAEEYHEMVRRRTQTRDDAAASLQPGSFQ